MNNMKPKYRASLSRNQGRKSWCIIFQHPVLRTPTGKLGRRIRRGLGTSDNDEAESLVEEMNQLLSEESFWTLSARERASKSFDPRVVGAFFDDMTPAGRDSWSIRDSSIPLPGKDDGFTRIQLLGTTGAGKTTLLRQLIGTDPESERFPSTSPARTTICDIEVVADPSSHQYSAVVSFVPRDLVLEHIEDNLKAAIIAAAEGRSENDVRRKFLTHVEQRFRLNYILGNIIEPSDAGGLSDDDDELFDEAESAPKSLLSEDERLSQSDKLRAWLNQVGSIAKERLEAAESELKINLESASNEERDFLLEWIEESLSEDNSFRELLDQIFDEIECRFEYLQQGTLNNDSSGWPLSWTYSSKARKEFIQEVNRFSSNWAPNFGRLLTPIVDGVRVHGPFAPVWTSTTNTRLVLLDGQGLGHTLDSASSVSTRVTKRYDMVDAILLVDSAAQPMQAAPFEVLKSVVSSGHERKLAVCFTHFESVKGDNLSTPNSKRSHVLSSLENAISSVGSQLGRMAELALRRVIDGRVYFVGNIHEIIPERARLTKSELNRLVEGLSLRPEELSIDDIHPVYDSANLVLVLQKAVRDFHQPWMARLGFQYDADYPKQHWARVKALSRRLGVFGEDEYDNLKPVADLIKFIADNLIVFIGNPLRWKPHDNIAEEVKLEVCSKVARDLFARIQEVSTRRLFLERAAEWSEAFFFSGRGSASERADKIRSIYEMGAPIPGTRPDPQTTEFLAEMKRLVNESIKAVGGDLL
jgi:hypothetical protein